MMKSLVYEISLDHRMGDEYIEHAKEEMFRNLGYEVGKIISDKQYHVLKLIEEEPPHYWREYTKEIGSGYLYNSPPFKIRYTLEIGIAQERRIEYMAPIEEPPIPTPAYMLALNPSRQLIGELWGRVDVWGWIESNHNNDIDKFNGFMDG